MKSFFLILISCILINTNVSAQSVKRDSVLIKQINAMFKDDQFWRKEFIKINKKQHSDYDPGTIQQKWEDADSINEIKAKNIISKYGYPGYNLVGDASNNFWAIVQHCDDDVPFQEHVLALMKRELNKNNASKENYAYLVDRVLVGKHQKQIYGTQVYTNQKTHKSTPLPLKYPKTVNKLRHEMGLDPIELYLKSFE